MRKLHERRCLGSTCVMFGAGCSPCSGRVHRNAIALFEAFRRRPTEIKPSADPRPRGPPARLARRRFQVAGAHMGWNTVLSGKNHRCFAGIEPHARLASSAAATQVPGTLPPSPRLRPRHAPLRQSLQRGWGTCCLTGCVSYFYFFFVVCEFNPERLRRRPATNCIERICGGRMRRPRRIICVDVF